MTATEQPRLTQHTMRDGRTRVLVEIGRHRYHATIQPLPGTDINGRPLGTRYWIRHDETCVDEEAAIEAAIADIVTLAATACGTVLTRPGARDADDTIHRHDPPARQRNPPHGCSTA
jgi:hypothetical protein